MKKCTRIYKGEKLNYQMDNSPKWFAFTEDIKLINLMDRIFHHDYMHKFNMVSHGCFLNGVDDTKQRLGVPIGLPNYEEQLKYLKKQRVNIVQVSKWSDEHETALQWINGKNRYSEFNRDKEFASVLYKLYSSSYDGYMTKLLWPSKLHDGFFMREICLFVPLMFVKKLGYIGHTGGTVSRTYRKKIVPAKGTKFPPGETWHRLVVNPWNSEEEFLAQVKEFEKLLSPESIQYLQKYPK